MMLAIVESTSRDKPRILTQLQFRTTIGAALDFVEVHQGFGRHEK